jgi:hypothetical protein
MPEHDPIIRRDGDAECCARQINAEDRTIRFLAQSTKLASDNLIILANAGKKHSKEFMRNPIVVPYHKLIAWDDVTPVVVGNVVKDEFETEGRVQTVKFATSELAEQWWHLYAVDKVMRMVSIAWYRAGEERETDPTKMVKLLKKHSINLGEPELAALQGVVKTYKQRDLSLVPIGADPDAMQHSADGGNSIAQGFMRGFEETGGLWVPREGAPQVHINKLGMVVESTPGAALEEDDKNATGGDSRSHEMDDTSERAVIPYKKYPLAPEGAPWDGPGEVRKATPEKLRVMCTWYDSKNPDVKGSYKLPHHRATGFTTVWRGVSAAMAVVFGARGGLKGEAATQRRGIYNHLKKHYQDFDKEAPPFREEACTEVELRELGFTDDDIYGTLPEQVAAALMPQVRELVNDTIEPLADQVADLCDQAIRDVNLEVTGGNDDATDEEDTDQEQYTDTEEAGGGEPGGAGDEADAHTDGEALPPESPYAELLDMSRNMGKPAPLVVPGVPTDLLGHAQAVAQGLQPKEEKKED